jgi:hypothetical protein
MWIVAILRRNLVRLLLTFLAVALVTYLMVWQVNDHRGEIRDCVVKDTDGQWQQVPCS